MALWVFVPGASALPADRAYELVSPVDKNLGSVARVLPASDDGNAIGLMTLAAPDGAAGAQLVANLVARRTDSGWRHETADAPGHGDAFIVTSQVIQYSEDFTRAAVASSADLMPDDDLLGLEDVFLIDVGSGTAGWVSSPGLAHDDLAMPVEYFAGASRDLSRIVITAQAGSVWRLYERTGNAYRPVSVIDGELATEQARIAAAPWTWSGTHPQGGPQAGYAVARGGANAVSHDGSRIFFRLGSGPSGPLYMRQSGVATIAVSASERTGEEGQVRQGTFIGATPDGSVAFFASDAQLTDTATPGGGIYRRNLEAGPGEEALRLVTPDAGGPTAGVQTAIISPDGTRVYFVATAALAEGATAGQRNAYVWSEDGGTTFIATLGSDGEVARVSRNGRYALFTTSGSVGGAPNNGHVAIYRYDTQTAELACVSCRPDGSASQGDASLDRMPPAALRDHQPARNITDDGGVVFATRDRLVPEDISDAADVYLYDDGELSLISSGRSAAHNYVADNTDDGRSIFFLTTDSLVPQDTDTGLWDLYVARVSGGFREDGDAAQPCDGDACQGEQPDRPFLEPPQSGPGGEGNTVPEDPPARQRPRRSLSFRLPPALVRRALARGTAQVPVRVSGGGTIRVRATARIRGRTRIVATAVRRVTRTSAITVRVPLRLRAIARRELRRVGRLRVTVEVRMTGVDRPVRRTFTLRRATR